MNALRMALCACLVGVLFAGAAMADGSGSQLAQPSSIVQTTFEYDNYLYFAPEDAEPGESPSDQPAPAAEPAEMAPVAEADCGAPSCGEPTSCGEPSCCGTPDCGCNTCRWCRCGSLEDAWKLASPCAQQCGIDYGGWISAGIITNAHGANNNGAVAGFNDLTSFNAHQAWTYLEKAVDTSKYGIDWGGRVDFLFGTDAIDTQCFGDGSWDFGWNSSRDYGWAMPQLYAEVGIGDLKVKAGHFYTIIGYEVVQAPQNFFFSHAITMYYGEPFTHTGALAEYPICGDRLTAYSGWTAGWDSGFGNRFGGSTYLGGLSFALCDHASITWASSFGYLGYDRAADNDLGSVYMNSIVFSWDLSEKLTYVLQHDYGTNYGAVVDDNQWYGINQYFLYAWNDCLGSGARIEWFRDDDGARTGAAGDYTELTLGLNVRPHTNFVVRPEIRWDWYNGSDTPPFANGTKKNQLSGGFDVIFTF